MRHWSEQYYRYKKMWPHRQWDGIGNTGDHVAYSANIMYRLWTNDYRSRHMHNIMRARPIKNWWCAMLCRRGGEPVQRPIACILLWLSKQGVHWRGWRGGECCGTTGQGTFTESKIQLFRLWRRRYWRNAFCATICRSMQIDTKKIRRLAEILFCVLIQRHLAKNIIQAFR